MLLAITAFVVWEQVDSRRRLVRDTLAHAGMLADNCKASIAFEHKQDAEQVLSSLRAQDSIVFACLYDKHGLVFAEYQRGSITEKIRPPLPRKDSRAFENGSLSVFKQIVLDNEIIGTIYLRDDMRHLYSELKWDIAFAVVLLLFGLVMSYFLSSMFQKMISRPILNLTYVAQKVSKKNDYSVRAIEESDDEVGYLTQVFNRMLGQIQQRDSALVEAKGQLEIKVRERTADLTTTNKHLTKEIAERVKAEEQVRQQNKFLNTVLESLTHPFYVIDANDYTIKMANSALYPGKLPEKTTCYTLTHKQDKPCSGSDDPCPLEEIKKTKRPVVIEHVHYDKDGNTRNVEVHAYPILDDKGNVYEIIEYTLDITERKQAEAKLKQVAEEWIATFDSITDMVSIHDKDFKIVRANKAFASAFKMKPSEIIGKNCCDLIHGTKEPPSFCPHKRTLDTGKPNSKEFFDPYLGIHVEASTSPIFDENGQVMASVHIVKDITERKQAEAELKAAQEKLIDTAHRAGMAEVAADVLHNVGNVLNSINVSTTVIREKVTRSELANLEKVASIINEHIDDLGTFLTEDPQGKHIPVYLTEVSKCLQGEQTYIIDKLKILTENVQHIKDIVSTQQSYAKVSGVEVPTSLSKLAEDAIQINSAGLERHGTRLIREFEELGDVEIDKQKVLQILVNLVSNAKYALSGSDKEEKLLTIRIYKHSEERFRVEVADNGVGISEDNLAKIFSHGFTTKEHGHGFGLHSCALAAEEIGGSLTVHSDGVGKGATFTLELPFKPVGVVA
jgi:PAS domain S-box-containing protein